MNTGSPIAASTTQPDEAAVMSTLMAWRVRLSAAAWMIVRDVHASEDIFQSVALKALRRPGAFDSEASLVSWSFVTARREALDWLRRHRREERVPGEDLLDLMERDWLSREETMSAPRLEALRACLETTPEASRRLLHLRYHEGRSCDEVAATLGLAVDAVYKRLSRLHQALRDCVGRRLGPVADGMETPPRT